MSPSTERRRAFRIPVLPGVICYLKVHDKQYQGVLRDMSVTGLYVELENQPMIAEKCEVDIVLNGESSRLIIEGLQGSIVRCDDDGVAIQLDARMEWFPLVSTYFYDKI